MYHSPKKQSMLYIFQNTSRHSRVNGNPDDFRLCALQTYNLLLN